MDLIGVVVIIQGEQLITHLNTLAFVSVPKHSALSAVLVRLNRLIDRLEEQKRLAADHIYVAVTKRWKKWPDDQTTKNASGWTGSYVGVNAGRSYGAPTLNDFNDLLV